MNLEALIKSFRTLSNDRVRPYFTSNESVIEWLNEAQMEAAIRKRLIVEDALDAVCRIPLTVGTSKYVLHPSVYEIINIRMLPGNGDHPRDLVLKSREWMDANISDWRSPETMRWPTDWVIQDDTSIRVSGTIEVDDEIAIECYRTPLVDMAADEDVPEIHNMHHRKLIQWALYRAFSVPDSELFDPKRSELAEREFTQYFGLRPDADARRTTRIDVPHHTYQSII